jgi:hypothetical protein
LLLRHDGGDFCGVCVDEMVDGGLIFGDGDGVFLVKE